MVQSAQMLNPTDHVTRRQFLAIGWTVAGLVAAGEAGAAILAFMYPRQETGEVIIGSRQDVMKNLPDAKSKPDATFAITGRFTGRFYLSRTPDGILALYLKCTHLGCGVPWNEQEDQFHCGCHGALYNRKGEVLGGPAPRPLDYFAISQKGNTLVVDTSNPLKRSSYQPSQAFPLST
jgi:cytochrome b6-f complex iron-sulfur subunit